VPADSRHIIVTPRGRPRNPWASDDIAWPEYCCAILIDAEGRYLIERRSAKATTAPGQLACFGGKREPMEHPDRCIRREIKEELGWSVGALRLVVAVRLRERSSGREIAWFYRGSAPRATLNLKSLPGSSILHMSAREMLAAPDLSAWHRAAIIANEGSEPVAWIEDDASARTRPA
jgi:8-oxo-dGTP pyrophosphatase MutT (NUDIX family)